MNKIIQAQPLPGGYLRVEFADGRRGYFDVKPYMASDFFAALQQEAYFRQVRLFFAGVGWPEGQDLGPDTIAAGLQASEPATCPLSENPSEPV